MKRLDRRTVLQAGTAAAASTVVPVVGYGGSRDQSATVVVIGGGLSGLAAATELGKRGIESVIVLEARDRVGGRTLNLDLPNGHVVEGGGEWIGPGQDRIAAFAESVGVGTFPAFYDGDTVYEIMGRVSRGFVPDLKLADGAQFVRLAWKLQSMADDLPAQGPWLAANAAQLDRTTLFEWLVSEGADPWAIEAFRIVTRAVMSGFPERISLLWFLFYLQSGGGLLRIALNDNGLQDLRIQGGSQLISIRAAERLGERVCMEEPVVAVEDLGDAGVRVVTRKRTIRADRVIVAMAPADALRIDFVKGLPEQRMDLTARWSRLPRLPLIKHSVIYDTPFWRMDGLNGNVVTDRAPFQLVFDNSPPDGSLGVLTCFLSAGEVPGLASLADRQAKIPKELVRYFGAKAAKPVGWTEKDWSTDPWSVGCITPLVPGILVPHGSGLRDPVGNIHWAGTESAIRGCGYMDGAVRAGERAASEVFERSG